MEELSLTPPLNCLDDLAPFLLQTCALVLTGSPLRGSRQEPEQLGPKWSASEKINAQNR